MKKLLAIAAVMSLVSIVGCGNAEQSSSTNDTDLAFLGYSKINPQEYAGIGCTTESGKTKVAVNKQRNGEWRLTAYQDGYGLIYDNVRVDLHARESFPETYYFSDVRTGNSILSLGQDLKSGSDDIYTQLAGRIVYNKLERINGQLVVSQKDPEVLCEASPTGFDIKVLRTVRRVIVR